MAKLSGSEIWSVVHHERQALIDDLAVLETDEWCTPSLCPGWDVRRPLKIDRNYSPAHVARALAYQVKTSVSMGGGKEMAQGWHLIASDAPFEHGDGPKVHGPAIALLLAVSGRPVKVDELTGPGAHNFGTTPGEES